ncbi:MAG: sigma-70 family RNA polymerase sigma factor [Patescibacteria group bacterium]
MEEHKKQFEETYEMYADAIYKFCVYKTSDPKQAEDLAAETFIRLWEYVASGKDIENTKSFLYQIARNLIIDFYRKKKSSSLEKMQDEGFEPSNDDYEKIQNTSEIRMAIDTINTLEEKYRDVVYMKLVEEMDLKGISESLNITINNATVRLHRGLKQLQKLIENQNNGN